MISQTGRYALNALIYLAEHSPESGFFLARDIGRELSIPEQYLSKILHVLARKGVLLSQKGRHGGFRLQTPSDEISLFEVLDSVENVGRFERCILGPGKCDEEHPCALHDMWTEVISLYVSALKSTTLAQLVDRH